MLGLDADRIVERLSYGEREPAPPLPQGTLSAEAVPPAHRPPPLPLMRILMPVVMVAAMAALVGLMLLGGGAANPVMLLFPLMMGMSLLMMFSPPQGQDIDEIRRTYLRHLGALREKALANAAAQRAHEIHRHPDPRHLWAGVDSRRLWERGPEDPDTLEVRIGVGDTALCTPVQVTDPGAPEDLDPVCAVSLRRTVRAVGTLPELPVVVQLQAFRFLGIAGPRATELARSIIAQLVVAHGPDTLGLQVMGQGWEWTKWLPHTQDPGRARHRVLLVADVVTTGTESFIDDPEWTTIIDVGSRSTTALGLRAEQEGLALGADEELTVHTATGIEVLGQPDLLSTEESVVLARALTRYRRPDAPGAGGGAEDLLSLLGVADIDHLTPEVMWPGRQLSRQRLAVPIGTTAQGAPVRLDLKESAQGGMGPHGLCIGATGSGKSELLRTLVVSLAATHSPDELNLVLVDFKGGATFLGLEDLPHTSAMITNLSEESVLVERMYDAISGELTRRQELLRSAGNFANVSDYTDARLNTRPDLDPLPALLIVVDEFSELLAAHPDFADLFVAVGRLGRSLHVHLLLASQRLEEGRLRGLDSHLSYRIGLKTFSAAESRQVLGVVDAHHLPAQPGAGYLRHEADQLTRFRAAYVSGPLPRRDLAAVPGRQTVSFFTGWEQFEQEQAPIRLDESTTLLDAVVDAACTTARVRGQAARRIWLPPLPASVELAGVAENVGSLQVVLGIIDRPFHQRQDQLILDLASGGGHVAVCGGPQTGKSTVLRTFVASLAATHDTASIRFYVLDLGGGVLDTLDRLPHVAGVAGRGEPERVRRVVDEVLGLVEEPEPHHTFLVVDGWHAVLADHEDLVEPLTRLAADGPSARVHLIVSTPRWTVLRPAVRDLITHRLELKLGESMDSLIDRKAQQKLPALPGRGLSSEGATMLIALSSNQDLAHIAATALAAGQKPVPQLRVLPTHLQVAELVDAGPGVPFALGGARLEALAWDPGHSPHLVCVGGQGAGKSTLLRTLTAGVAGLGRERARMVVIDHRRSLLGHLDQDVVAAYSATTTTTATTLDDTVTTLSARLPGPDITPAELSARSWWSGPEIYLIIDDLDLVSETDLHRLAELLPHARDIGLHLVLARKSGGIGRAMFSPFLAAVRDQQPAVLLLDADREEGPVFGIRPTTQPPGRGTWQVRGETLGVCQVALPTADAGTEREENQ